jgi:hypothetical protein
MANGGHRCKMASSTRAPYWCAARGTSAGPCCPFLHVGWCLGGDDVSGENGHVEDEWEREREREKKRDTHKTKPVPHLPLPLHSCASTPATWVTGSLRYLTLNPETLNQKPWTTGRHALLPHCYLNNKTWTLSTWATRVPCVFLARCASYPPPIHMMTKNPKP